MGYQIPTEAEMTIAKVNQAKKQVFGWANIANAWKRVAVDGFELAPVIDWQGGIMEIEALENSAYAYVTNSRQSGEEHLDYRTGEDFKSVGYAIESMVFTREKQTALGIPAGIIPEGWWVGFQITNDAVWSKIVAGKYTGFSIQGRVNYTEDEIPTSELGNYDLPGKEDN